MLAPLSFQLWPLPRWAASIPKCDTAKPNAAAARFWITDRRRRGRDGLRRRPCGDNGRHVSAYGVAVAALERILSAVLGPGLGVFLAAGLAAPASAATCPDAGGEVAVVSAVEPRLELRLADGRLVRLIGVEAASQTPGDPDLGVSTRSWLAARIAGREVSLVVVGDKPDRWGRLAAFVFVPTDGHAEPLASTMLAAGLARYQPEPAAHGCRDLFVAAEATARAARLGVWRDPYYAVLGPDDRAAFRERSATMVVVEGRLTAVETGPYRTKLWFAARDGGARGALAAAILPRVMKLFEGRDMKLASMIGRTVRVRGLLDLRFGPQIEVESPDALEIVPTSGAAASPPPPEHG